MKQLLLFLVSVLAPVSLSAQIINNIQTSYQSVSDTVYSETGSVIVQKDTKQKIVRPTTFNDTWYVSASIGPHIYFGENEWMMNAADAVTFAFDLSGGRWFTPYIAADFNLNFHKFRGIYCPHWGSNANFATNEWYGNVNKTGSEGDYFWQKGQYMNAYFRLLFDLTCMNGRSRNERVNHFVPFIGLGYAFGTGSESKANSPTFNVGLMWEIRFTNKISMNITARGALLSDKFDGEVTSEHGFDGMVGLTAGIIVNSSFPHRPQWCVINI